MLLFVVLINDPCFLLSSRRKKFSSLVWAQTSNCFSLVAGFHLKFWDVFHKPATSLFVSLLVLQQFRYNLLGRVLSKLICGRSWHFLLHSVIPMTYLLFFFRRHCDVALFTRHLELLGSCSFHVYPFNRSVVPFAQVLFILSSFVSLFNLSAVWNPSYPLCHSFQ